LVVEWAIGELVELQEGPDVVVGPVEDREDAHEGGPARAAGGQGRQVRAVGVGPAVA